MTDGQPPDPAHSTTLAAHLDCGLKTYAWSCLCGETGYGELDWPGATYADARTRAATEYQRHLITRIHLASVTGLPRGYACWSACSRRR